MSAWTGKPCNDCGGKKGRAYARRRYCGNCTRKRDKASRDAQWAAYIFRTYGITKAEYDELYEFQGGCCALCTRATGKTKRLSVDHDHVTGEVRGLLCGTCNKILGHARDDAAFFARGLGYLQTPPWRLLRASVGEAADAERSEPPAPERERDRDAA